MAWLFEAEPTKAEDQLVWFLLYLVIYLAFYFFTSPFVGNRELLNSWTPYVYFSMILYAWLFSAAALHTPVHALGLLDSTIKQPFDDLETLVPGSYGGAILIWCMGMLLATTNFFLERVSGVRVISSFGWFSNRAEEDGSGAAEDEDGSERLAPDQNLPMVPWYSMLLIDTGFDLLISLKVFLGRFDMRTMQRALHPNDEDYCFDHLAKKDEVWLDFMADCGDGFNSSYQIARLLAQPQLEVDCKVSDEKTSGKAVPDGANVKAAKNKTVKRVFPRVTPS
uniref:Uncharacterized protein n=1 Tax=Hyaloperonospora arabidopsidis (strain Emoy2) TaxID=559515 RepID=M4B9Z6_HYAAE